MLSPARAAAVAEVIAGAARRMIARLAEHAPVRVFALVGLDAPRDVSELRLHRDIRLVDAPRSANLLLVVGTLPSSTHAAARQIHDMLAQPRCTLRWTVGDATDTELFPHAERLTVAAAGMSPEDAVQRLALELRKVHVALLRGDREPEPPLLPDVDPAPWRGVGPYGQGGTGMTGGVPYGRPMAERAPDRDGLELDQLPVRVGPFFMPFPAGLVLDVKLQGDVIQEAIVPGNAFSGAAPPKRLTPFTRALTEPVGIAEIECARAEHHLRWLDALLHLHGLDALGRRALALSLEVRRGGSRPNTLAKVRALRVLLERTRGLAAATADIGRLPDEVLHSGGLGPVARAAGIAEDARIDDPAYARLRFTPLVQGPAGQVGDARSRWRQRLAEVEQSLVIALHAGEAATGGGGISIEGPRGAMMIGVGQSSTERLLAQLPTLLAGVEWGDAVAIVMSLDLDLRDAVSESEPLRSPPVVEPGGERGDMPGMAGMPGMGEGAMTA